MANIVAMPASWNLLELDEETDLHKHRLLNVEEKPFRRIAKRLSTLSGLVTPATQTHPPEAQNGASDTSAPAAAAVAGQCALLEEDLTLDFAAFDCSIARLQLLLDANARERERYQAEQTRIIDESAAVRVRNAELREQLEASRANLGRRRRFDELADKITANRALRPRAEQSLALRKLEEECAELEREKDAYGATWRERRHQFNRIVEESMHLRRLIRDEIEVVDNPGEGMDEDGDGSSSSRAGKAAGSDHLTPMVLEHGSPARETPRPGPTAASGTPDLYRPTALAVLQPDGQNGASRGVSTDPSERSERSVRQSEDGEIEEGEHVEMESGEGVALIQTTTEEGTPRITADGPQNEDKMELDTSG